MIEQKVTISNKAGLHARAAALFVQKSNFFSSTISVTKDGQSVNGKSIMGIMMLAGTEGSEINISAVGSDEEAAVFELVKLVTDKFGEGV